MKKIFGASWTGDVTGGLTILAALSTAAISIIHNGQVSVVDLGLVVTGVTSGIGLINAKSQSVTNSPTPVAAKVVTKGQQ